MTRRSSQLTVLYAVTASTTAAAFLRGQLRSATTLGEVGLVVGDAPPAELASREGVQAFSVNLPRRPSPLRDALALARLIALLLRTRPSAVVFGTPKMSLMAAIATRLCGTPVRIYVVHGLRLEGYSGPKRRALARLELLVCRLATDVIGVSPSVCSRIISDVGADQRKVRMIGHGSANGIDADCFVPLPEDMRRQVRAELGIGADQILFTFIGRLTHDKGLHQLPQVWDGIADAVPGAHLLIVGPAEFADGGDVTALESLKRSKSVSVLGEVADVARYLGTADVNLSLSRREGMPTVILEAGACEVPTVGYDVTGVRDAVVPGAGTLVQLDAIEAFIGTAIEYGCSEEMRISAGMQARSHVLARFKPEGIWSEWNAFLALRLKGENARL